jgi:signal transduction histidine kinase
MYSRVDKVLDELSKIDPYILLSFSDPRLGTMSGWMQTNDYRDMVCVPVKQANNTYLFYAIRSNAQPAWENPDLELIVIFARQAAVALENAHLYNELKDFIHQLEESQRSLIMAEKMAALGRLMASLAHELNNPLQSVQNCLHLAERSDLPESQRLEFIALARQEVERVSLLAQTAMEYYRPKRLIRQTVELLGLLETVLNLVEPQVRSNQITISREFPDHPIEIELIRDNIQQVTLNLLLNAMDSLSAKLDQRNIWIEVRDLETEVEIFFEDNGAGIAPEVEERLFEPFVSTKADGSGLGLSISYELIVDVHGGELGFVPPLHGQGARVRISLPRKD